MVGSQALLPRLDSTIVLSSAAEKKARSPFRVNDTQGITRSHRSTVLKLAASMTDNPFDVASTAPEPSGRGMGLPCSGAAIDLTNVRSDVRMA